MKVVYYDTYIGETPYEMKVTSTPVTAKKLKLDTPWTAMIDKKVEMMFATRALAMEQYCRLQSYRCVTRSNPRRASYWLNQALKWEKRNRAHVT